MAHLRHFAAAPVIVILMGGSAHAALTADQIWQSWKDGAALVGLNITAATESNSGGVLTLNGISIAPAGESEAFTISDMTLTENADGTVAIRPGDAIGLDVGTAEEGGKIALTHDGLSLVAKEGGNGGIVYDYSAAKLDLAYDFTSPGYSFDESQPAEPGKEKGTIGFQDLSGQYSDTPGDNRTFGLTLAAAKLIYDISSDQPAFGMKTAQTSETDSITIGGEFALPSGIALGEIDSAADFGQALQQGLSVKLNTTQGVSKGTASQQDMFLPYDMVMEAGAGTADLLFNKDVFSLTSKGDGGFTMDITTPASPAPVKISMDTIEMNLLSPVMSGETAGDYGLVMKLGQLVLNDEVWGMFDPGAALKREPFDLAVDLAGKAKVDWIAMIVADETGGPEVVPEPESLNINQMALKLAGAALDATGALTFDNAAGFPAPLGEATVNISGADQLINGLIATGILSEDDAMMARMMMGGFMVPGSEPDTLTSKVEFKEGFQIFANGQQIQ